MFAHNVETVERCTPFVRDRRANFEQSLRVLEEAKKAAEAQGREMLTKTSIMLGVGEEGHEIEETLRSELQDASGTKLTNRTSQVGRRCRDLWSVHATH